MRYFSKKLDADKLTVEQIVRLGGTFNSAAPTALEFLIRETVRSWELDGTPTPETEVLVFNAGDTPKEDWATVEDWGNDACSPIRLTWAEFQELPISAEANA